MFEERADEIAVPTMVFGFRIEDADLPRRVSWMKFNLPAQPFRRARPELSAHLQRDQIAVLTLRLDGSMIPWTKSADRKLIARQSKIRELVSKD